MNESRETRSAPAAAVAWRGFLWWLELNGQHAVQRKGRRTPQAVRCNDWLCRATFEGTAVEVANSIPKLYPRRRRLRRQAASVPCGRRRTEESKRPAWLEQPRSRRPKARVACAQPEPEKASARCPA
jgi:hypothetical protein